MLYIVKSDVFLFLIYISYFYSFIDCAVTEICCPCKAFVYFSVKMVKQHHQFQMVNLKTYSSITKQKLFLCAKVVCKILLASNNNLLLL